MKTKIISLAALAILFSMTFASCGSDGDSGSSSSNTTPATPAKAVIPTFDAPTWAVSNTGSYENTMTLVAVLPDSLRSTEAAADKLAIFSQSSECRGYAQRVEVTTGNYIWMAMVYGGSTNESMTIKYYSSSSKHMYVSATPIQYTKNGVLGTIDSPTTIGMNVVMTK